jgi:hypothetical protein
MRIGEDAMPEQLIAIRLVKRADADGAKLAHPIARYAVARLFVSRCNAVPLVAAGGARFNMAIAETSSSAIAVERQCRHR